MGFVFPVAYRNRTVLLLLAGALTVLTVLFSALAAYPAAVTAQISPLSPMTVATETPLPPVQTDASQSSPADQSSTPDRDLVQVAIEQPLIPLGEPLQAPPSLILVGALLVGLVLLVIAVLIVRRRE